MVLSKVRRGSFSVTVDFQPDRAARCQGPEALKKDTGQLRGEQIFAQKQLRN